MLISTSQNLDNVCEDVKIQYLDKRGLAYWAAPLQIIRQIVY